MGYIWPGGDSKFEWWQAKRSANGVARRLYARYMKPHPSTGTPWSVGAADVSVLSDLSAFIGHENPSKHRILAAGDLNIFYGATGDALSLPAGRYEERPDLLQPAAGLAGQGRPPVRLCRSLARVPRKDRGACAERLARMGFGLGRLLIEVDLG